ncbi:MAG: protein-disulfide reductase DsbD [Metallibacterium sp.]
MNRLFLLLSVLLSLAGVVTPAQAADGLLRFNQAYRLSARAEIGVAHLDWAIAPGYYLYRDRTHFKALDAGVTLGKPAFPQGVVENDPYLGRLVVFYKHMDATLPFSAPAGLKVLRLAVTYQGCHAVAPQICFPPHTEALNLPIGGAMVQAGKAANALAPPAAGGARAAFGVAAPSSAAAQAFAAPAAAATPSASSSAAPAGEAGRLAGLLGKDRVWALLLFFLGGLGVAFTPCVLPMLPILSGLIAGGGTRARPGRAFALSLVYVLGAALVYAAVGLIAGLAGTNLQAALQNGWAIGAMALLFVLLALSMFGLYELQLPARLQTRLAGAGNRQHAGSLLGAGVMGVLSALIVTSCVTPVLAAGVIYIGQQGSAVFGALALFVFGLGMGLPLLAFGTAAGALLPRAGGWMNTVKAVFGVLFLVLAIGMLDRVLTPGWILALSGLLLLGCAVYLGVLQRLPAEAGGWHKLRMSLALILLLLGAAELAGALAGSRALLNPLAVFAGTGVAPQSSSALHWQRVTTPSQLDTALARARAAHQGAIVDYYADWCVACKEMEATTLVDPAVERAIAPLRLIRVDVTTDDAASRALLKRYDLLGPPATLFFAPDGREQRAERLIGTEGAVAFLQRIDRAGL